MSKSHDELLDEAIAAHIEHMRIIEESRARRSKAFAVALRSTVTARELAKAIGISDTQVTRISKGQA